MATLALRDEQLRRDWAAFRCDYLLLFCLYSLFHALIVFIIIILMMVNTFGFSRRILTTKYKPRFMFFTYHNCFNLVDHMSSYNSM